MGKGDHRRPLSVDRETFANNWDRIKWKVDEVLTDEQKESRQALSDALEAVFSPEGIGDIEPVPGASEGDKEAGETGYEGPTPHVEGG